MTRKTAIITILMCCLISGCGRNPKSVKVAAIQTYSNMADPKVNSERLEKLITEAAENGAKIVVLPETAVSGYMSWDIKTTWQVKDQTLTPGLEGISPVKLAETVPGPSVYRFAELAKELKIYLTIPLLEVDPKEGRYYNTVVVVGPKGRILMHYRKRNPWPHAERGWASRGNLGNVCVDTEYGRLGVLICYDINYEPSSLKEMGVDHLLYCIAWVDDETSTWFSERLPNIAAENDLNIIGANWSVPEGFKADWHGYGMSRIISKKGFLVSAASGDHGSEIVYANLLYN